MLSLKDSPDPIIYIKSLLDEGFTLPSHNVIELLNIYNYKISNIKLIEPKNEQKRLTLSKIREEASGISLFIYEKSWADYLPAVYRNKDLSDFLYGFQLTMLKQMTTIDKIENLFTPEKTPDELVNWLGFWFNISFSNKIKIKNKRKILYKLTSLYNTKGTSKYLKEMVYLLTDTTIEIQERSSLLDHDKTECSSFIVNIEGEPPYHSEIERQQIHQIIQKIINTEKPIFTNAYFNSSFSLINQVPIKEDIITESLESQYIPESIIDEEAIIKKSKEDSSSHKNWF